MGIKRGAFENVGLGALAQSAKSSTVPLNSVKSGLFALASGAEAYAKGKDTIAKALDDWSKVFWDMADMNAKSRAAVRKNDQEQNAAAARYEEMCKTYGPDHPDTKAQFDKVVQIGENRKTLGFFMFGGDVVPSAKKNGEN